MAINVTLGEAKPQEEKPFPKLMISNEGRIVFMTHPHKGFQLNNAAGDGPHFYANWIMQGFTDYNEPLKLQNA